MAGVAMMVMTARRSTLRSDANPAGPHPAGPRSARRISGRMSSLVCLLLLVLIHDLHDLHDLAAAPRSQAPDAWAYDPEGRRDPFVSLLTRGVDLGPTRERPRGLAGLSVNEITLRGLVALDDDEYLAVFEAPDKKIYILRGGERLFDGSVKSVTRDAVVFLAEVSDPQSLSSAREVRRTLGGTEASP